MTIKIPKFVKAMKHKGFVMDEDIPDCINPKKNNPHPYLFFTSPEGTIFFHVCTFYSEKGWKNEFNDKEIATMARELHFSSRREFERFIECPKKREEYHAELVALGII